MEVRVLAHDEQSFTMLRHITKYPEFHMLINGVPGLGKTHLAKLACMLYGQAAVEATSYGKNCVDGMIEKGICDSNTLHSKCLQPLMQTVRQTKLFTLLDREGQMKRENERMKKAGAVLNTMYPPRGMGEDQQLTAFVDGQNGTSASQAVREALSMQCKVYGRFISPMMDAAQTARFGLKAISGPKNAKTGVTGHLDAGPLVSDKEAWRTLAHNKFVDTDLVESINDLDSDIQEELHAYLCMHQAANGRVRHAHRRLGRLS